MFIMCLADAHLLAKRPKEGLAAVSDGLSAANQYGDRRTDAELHRLQGELLLLSDDSNQAGAEAVFHEAIRIARTQEAKWFELRAACSLARLWQSQGKRKEALDLLKPVYDWFTEGFDTKDLIKAKALLEELA